MKPQGAYTVYYYCDIRPSDETTIRKHIEKWEQEHFCCTTKIEWSK